jgi:ethanolamine-phosphate cytidylyltransferase
MEGAFDLMHYGHMNAFRLGASLGTHLVVGVNSGETIKECKGTAPVMSDDERCQAVRGCRFVKEVVEKTPYVMTPEYLAWIIDEYKLDYVVHGDDPCLTVTGEDVYAHPKKIGKYKSIPRTEVSKPCAPNIGLTMDPY